MDMDDDSLTEESQSQKSDQELTSPSDIDKPALNQKPK